VTAAEARAAVSPGDLPARYRSNQGLRRQRLRQLHFLELRRREHCRGLQRRRRLARHRLVLRRQLLRLRRRQLKLLLLLVLRQQRKNVSWLSMNACAS